MKLCYVLSKSDHFTSNQNDRSQFHQYGETRVTLHAKWSDFENTPQNSTKFSTMLGEGKKMEQ